MTGRGRHERARARGSGSGRDGGRVLEPGRLPDRPGGARGAGLRRGPAALAHGRLHRVLAQGNFALAVSEGERAAAHTAFYDLYRVEAGKIVEHWDTIEAVAPPEEWENDNGKF